MNRRFLLLAVSVALAPRSLWACAACYGKSDSPLAAGMNWGIFTLLGTVVLVLGGCAAFFVYLARRAAAASAPSPLKAPHPALKLQRRSPEPKVLATQPDNSALTLPAAAFRFRAPRLVVRTPRVPSWWPKRFSLRHRKVRSRLSWSPPSAPSH